MKRYHFTPGLALAVAAAFGFTGPVTAGDQVPFKGRLEGVVTRSDPPPPIFVNVDATGAATQLGEFTLEIPHVVVPPNGAGFYLFVAANGDTLVAEFNGVSKLVAPGLLYIVENATITGGTGRFAGASGSFVCERLYDIAAAATVGHFDGTISRLGP